MIIAKFGGNTLKTASNFNEIAQIIDKNQPVLVVLSAIYGTTDALLGIADHLYKKSFEDAKKEIAKLESKYIQLAESYFKTNDYKHTATEIIKEHFDYIKSFTLDVFTMFEEKEVLAQGELLSTILFKLFLDEQGKRARLISALDFMRINASGQPDFDYIKENLENELARIGEQNIIITQGYICRNDYGNIDNLKRGGSDYTASIIGSILNCNEIQIWTNIDKKHNADNLVVDCTFSIKELSYDEAAELAYFGEKLIHPAYIIPAKDANIPIRILDINNPNDTGTLISSKSGQNVIKALAVKNGLTSVKIKSDSMLMAYGFLRKVFEVFETYETPIDIISTSEVSITVTIDKPTKLYLILEDLKAYGVTEIENNLALIGIIGQNIIANPEAISSIFNSLKGIPINMISMGGSNHNISIVLASTYQDQAITKLMINQF